MHSLELQMEYSVKNECVRWCNSTCCNWGQRMPSYDAQNNIVGNSAPLWINPSKTFYVLFFIVNFMVSILFISSFVAITFYNNSQLSLNATMLNSTLNGTNSTTNTTSNSTTNTTSNSTTNTTSNGTNSSIIFNPNITTLSVNDLACLNTIYSRLGTFFIIIGSSILLINAMYQMFLSMVEYATDEEWFRYLTFKLIILVFLIGFNIADYLFCINNMSYYNANSGVNQMFTMSDVTVCPQLYNFNLYANVIVSVLISLICVFQILTTLFNYKNLFFNNNQEEYRARCDDPDIIILGKN